MDDKELIVKAKKGDNDAFGALYKKYYQKIYRYCRINTGSNEKAQDICQETFVKAYKKINNFKTEGAWSFQAFLFTIARNMIIDDSRRKKEANIEDYEQLQSHVNLYDEYDRQEGIKKMQKVLLKLNEEERQIVVLRYFEELPSAEVAKILGINDGALRVRTFRVVKKIKTIFQSMYGQNN